MRYRQIRSIARDGNKLLWAQHEGASELVTKRDQGSLPYKSDTWTKSSNYK